MPESTLLRPFAPSVNVDFLKESATIAVSARAKALKAAGRHVIDLGAGEPDFDTPESIRRAAQHAIDAGATHYTATEGIPQLRQAIADSANADISVGPPIAPAEVVVSNGSKQSLFNACTVLFGPGDEVLIPTPSWTSYYEMVALSRACAVPVPGDPARSLKVSVDGLADAATPRTKGLMLNSPSNPTGAVYSRDELRAILELAESQGWWVISDEIYRHISYDGKAASVLELMEARDRLVLVNGVAKAYAMTGWRIGWAIAPKAVAATMTAFQSHTTSNAAAVSQHAALAAIRGGPEVERDMTHMVAQFRARRDAVLNVVREEPRLRCVHPAGAFYLYVNVSVDASDVDAGTSFAQRLLEHHDVAVVPGAAFGTPQWIRLSYAAPLEQVLTGVQRVVTAYRERLG